MGKGCSSPVLKECCGLHASKKVKAHVPLRACMGEEAGAHTLGRQLTGGPCISNKGDRNQLLLCLCGSMSFTLDARLHHSVHNGLGFADASRVLCLDGADSLTAKRFQG